MSPDRDPAIFAMMGEDEEEYRAYEEWKEWHNALTPEELEREQRSIDAYIQEQDEERQREVEYQTYRREANEDRRRKGLRKDGQPDRRFKRTQP